MSIDTSSFAAVSDDVAGSAPPVALPGTVNVSCLGYTDASLATAELSPEAVSLSSSGVSTGPSPNPPEKPPYLCVNCTLALAVPTPSIAGPLTAKPEVPGTYPLPLLSSIRTTSGMAPRNARDPLEESTVRTDCRIVLSNTPPPATSGVESESLAPIDSVTATTGTAHTTICLSGKHTGVPGSVKSIGRNNNAAKHSGTMSSL